MQTEDTKRRNGGVFHYVIWKTLEAIILNEIISCNNQLNSLQQCKSSCLENSFQVCRQSTACRFWVWSLKQIDKNLDLRLCWINNLLVTSLHVVYSKSICESVCYSAQFWKDALYICPYTFLLLGFKTNILQPPFSP